MTMIPAAFTGELHLSNVVMLHNGLARIGEIHTNATSEGTVALRLKDKAHYSDARITPETALILGQAIIRNAYRALDAQGRKAHD